MTAFQMHTKREEIIERERDEKKKLGEEIVGCSSSSSSLLGRIGLKLKTKEGKFIKNINCH